ncbi:hypothetical protein MIS46_02280 [Wielerella bovis]|uniref:hypothetical protein n=1 Tax=Wielerella bovis TaxID=2917790 RepID=UPI0020197B38|nr:hypothetical protein [Wielerella bovis]ULJ62918.1 hypothetical protein MIS46_02280 [Wielerella bovis]
MKKFWLFLLCISWGSWIHAETIIGFNRTEDQPFYNVRRQTFTFPVQTFLDDWKQQGFSIRGVYQYDSFESSRHQLFDYSQDQLLIYHKDPQSGTSFRFIFPNEQQAAEIIPILRTQEELEKLLALTESYGIAVKSATEDDKHLAVSVIAHAFQVPYKEALKMYDMVQKQMREKIARQEYEVYPDNFYGRLSKNGLFLEAATFKPGVVLIRIYKTDDVPEKSYSGCLIHPC